MNTRKIKTEIIDGLQVSVDMPEAEKDALRRATNNNDLELDEAAHLDPQQVKARLSMFIDQDLLDEIRRRAQEKGAKYQTFLNTTLRDVFLHQKRQQKEPRTLTTLSQALLNLSKANASQAATIAQLELKLFSLGAVKKRA